MRKSVNVILNYLKTIMYIRLGESDMVPNSNYQK
jgi:hypothetical protein